MPARQFFLMLKNSRRVRAWEHSVLTDIAAVAICDSKYHASLKKSFTSILVDKKGMNPDAPKAAKLPVIDSASDEAKHLFMNAILAANRRVN